MEAGFLVVAVASPQGRSLSGSKSKSIFKGSKPVRQHLPEDWPVAVPWMWQKDSR